MKKYYKNMGIFLIIFLAIVSVLAISRYFSPTFQYPYTYTDLITHMSEGKIDRIRVSSDMETNSLKVEAFLKPEAYDISTGQDDNDNFLNLSQSQLPISRIVPVLGIGSFFELSKLAMENGVKVETVSPPKSNFLMQILPSIVIMIVSIFVFMFIVQQMQGGAGSNKVLSFGKSKAKIAVDTKKKITFSQVAGLEEEKEELKEIVEFLKQPSKFTEIGARIPRGILLVGPPGTGKTYLAKAVSGEAGVPFFSISGSDFVEMFVGVGASRVRDLFEQAKKNTPCIVFIDEIDAVGRKRGAGLGGGHDEREQTLNQLLVEMDGFGLNEGVIIIAATNRPDILDPALLRPGRFDRRVVVGRPDVKGREAVLRIHSKTKKVSEDVDFEVIARTTAGFTPADLENLLNEAALLSARGNKTTIDMVEVKKAFVKMGIGTEKKSYVLTEKERTITAYHESGHAIIHEVLNQLDPTYMVSIIPTGMAGGYTMPLPSNDKMYQTKTYMEETIVSLLGGRAAEEIVLKDVTTGASNDIERATAMARDMVVKYGMSEILGPIQFGNDNEEVFIGKDLAHARNYGENVATVIDSEIKVIIQRSYDKALSIINEHINILHTMAKVLLEKEKITGEEIRALFPQGTLSRKNRSYTFLETSEA